MTALSRLPENIKQYLIVTGNYWAFTLTDGALRMLVVLYFHQLGYSPLNIALLFLFYEFFGVVTNLIGGWLGARIGLNKTMNIGLFLQIIALFMLCAPEPWLGVAYVMFAQALSGIAKDLNKMSAKSAIKGLVNQDAQSTLFKWVAILTGSKNALKGVGFFLGGLLLTWCGFQGAMLLMASTLLLVWLFSMIMLKQELGKAKNKPKFTELFSKSPAINLLSGARLCLFGARDVWFVVALPVFLSQTYGWDHWWVGGFLACWIIGYGLVQSFAPKLLTRNDSVPSARSAASWALLLVAITLAIAFGITYATTNILWLIIGLLIFGAAFAINSSLHSYLIVRYAKDDGVSLDIGFYYMANAAGRLFGTLLSGYVFGVYGMAACLYVSAVMLVMTWLISLKLPNS